jgi:hypothetical protein
MNKPYGFEAAVTPSTIFYMRETLLVDRIEISVHAGLLQVGYDREEDAQQARRAARALVDAWRARTYIPLEVNFEQASTWRPNAHGGVHREVSLIDHAGLTDRAYVDLETVGADGQPVRARLDSHSMLHDTPMLVKALKHKPLEDTLRFYSQEGLNPKRPLYGIFKAIEAITYALRNEQPDGRTALGKLVDKSKSNDEAKRYAGDIMQTANTIRHAQSKGTAVLTETECRERAYRLICAYAASLP